MSTASKLARGSVFRTLELLVVVGAAFFVTPALVHAFGARVYGFWTLVVAFIGYYGLLDFGLTQAAARYLSQALGKEDPGELDRVASTAFALFSALGACVLALTAASWAATPLLVKDPAEAALFRELLAVMGVSAALGFPPKVYTGMLQAGLRYDLIAAISIARSVVCNGAIYAAARTGRGVLVVALITLAASILQYGATYGAFKACFPEIEIRPFAVERARARTMLVHGCNTLFCQVGDVLRSRLDTVIVATFLGAALVTPYDIGVRIVEGYLQLVLGVVGMMLPVFSRYEGQGDFPAIRRALLQSTKLATVLSVFVGLSILFYGRSFIARWMGPGFGGAYGVAVILAAAAMIQLPQSPGVQLLYGLSQHRVYAVLNGAEGVVNIALSIWLTKRVGLYGAALGTLIEFCVFKVFVQPYYICRPIQLPVRRYLVDAVAWPLVKTAAPLGLFFLAARRFVVPAYGVIAACGVLQAALFAPIAYGLILDEGERALLRSALRALQPRRKGEAEAVSLRG